METLFLLTQQIVCGLLRSMSIMQNPHYFLEKAVQANFLLEFCVKGTLTEEHSSPSLPGD